MTIMTNLEIHTESRSGPTSTADTRYRFIIITVILFVVLLAFNSIFTLTALDKLSEKQVLSTYSLIGTYLQQKLAMKLHLLKDAAGVVEIEQLLNDTKMLLPKRTHQHQLTPQATSAAISPDGISLSVALPSGLIVQSTNEHLRNQTLPPELKVGATLGAPKELVDSVHYLKNQNAFVVALPVRDNSDRWVATVVLTVEEENVSPDATSVFEKHAQIFIILLTGIVFLILYITRMTSPIRDAEELCNKTNMFVIFLIISLALILSSALNILHLKDDYVKTARQKTEILVAIAEQDNDFSFSDNAYDNHQRDISTVWRHLIDASPEIQGIRTLENTGRPLNIGNDEEITFLDAATTAATFSDQFSWWTSSAYYSLKISLVRNEKLEYVILNLSKPFLFDKLLKATMDFMTIVIISVLLLVELLFLLFKYLERRFVTTVSQSASHYKVMRPAIFFLVFGIDLSMSFLPLHMEMLYEPLFGFSKDLAMGLPVSVEFLFAGIAILISGIWLDRRGWYRPFISGLMFAGIGTIYSCLAPDALQFIISRGFVGVGYGLSLMAAQGFVITHSDGTNKAQGLAHLFGGIYAGNICGGATGAMVAEWIPYSLVFLGGAVILFSVIIYTLLFMRDHTNKAPEQKAFIAASKVANKGTVCTFLFNRNIISLIFFSSLPASIAAVGFLNYFSPVYLNRIGVSQSTVGQILMIYGIAIIYVGPLISKYIDAAKNKIFFIFLGCLLGSFAFLTFNILHGLVAVAVAVFLLGLSNSLVLTSQSTYALTLKVTQELGEGKAIGIFRSTSRIGQMLGPIIFSSLVLANNIDQTITCLGLIYLLTAFLFLLLIKKG